MKNLLRKFFNFIKGLLQKITKTQQIIITISLFILGILLAGASSITYSKDETINANIVNFFSNVSPWCLFLSTAFFSIVLSDDKMKKASYALMYIAFSLLLVEGSCIWLQKSINNEIIGNLFAFFGVILTIGWVIEIWCILNIFYSIIRDTIKAVEELGKKEESPLILGVKKIFAPIVAISGLMITIIEIISSIWDLKQ